MINVGQIVKTIRKCITIRMKTISHSSLLAAALTLAQFVQSTPLSFSPARSDQHPLDINTPVQLVDGPNVPSCGCNGTLDANDPRYICGDPRLGPVLLPNKFPLLGIVSSYDRFGGLEPGQFLEAWWDNSSGRKWPGHEKIKGSWRWPKIDGFLEGAGNVTVNATTILKNGTILDRFGPTSGKFMAAADGPFNQRALPPSSLNADAGNTDWPSDFNVYKVIKVSYDSTGQVKISLLNKSDTASDRECWSGYAMVWTTGVGTQFNIGATGDVKTLVEKGYIQRIPKSELTDPHDRPGGAKCGQGIDPTPRKAAA